MKSYRFKKIDAFTDGRAPGNPAACVYLDRPEDIADREMLEIARQMKDFVREVAYLWPLGEGYGLRYFSAEREVAFCGHATIAAMYDLFSGDPERRGVERMTIEAGGNRLVVRNEIAQDNAAYVAAPPPRYLKANVDVDDLARALNIGCAALDGDAPVALVDGGLATLLVPMRRASALTDVKPDFELLRALCEALGADIALLYTDDAILPGNAWRTRVFAPRFGYLEDPATGSGNAALGYHLLRERRWRGQPISIEQGVSYRSPNTVRLRAETDGGDPRVLFGGSAVVRIDGRYLP